MLDKVKCDCGHANPPGTEICESCGKPQNEEESGLLNMRYEGAARRSQTYNQNVIDRIWNFFSSVKIAVWIIVITLLASILGTIFPQQMYIPSNANPFEYYADRYGTLGYFYVILGLHNMYSSWWFITLIVMIGISLVICSLDRVIPLYRALKKQRVYRHPAFLQRQRVFVKAKVDDPKVYLDEAKKALTAKGYKVRTEGEALTGEKGRFSRWGPYVIHIGLIIFLIGVLMRLLPGFTIDDYIWVRDGQTVPVKGTTEFYVKSEGFFLEIYEDGDFPRLDEVLQGGLMPRQFRTEAVLFRQVRDTETGEIALKEVHRHPILVNDPLVYEGIKLYQADYRLNEFSEFTFNLVEKATDEILGQVVIDLNDPLPAYQITDEITVTLFGYYPDFVFDSQNNPTTRSNIPNNPSMIFITTSPDQPEGERSWIFLGRTIEDPERENLYEFKLADVKLDSVSGLMVRKEVSMPVMASGGIVLMIGLIMCFYWQHRRIWFQREADELWLAAHTNKNYYALRTEILTVTDKMNLPITLEDLEENEELGNQERSVTDISVDKD